MTPDQQIERLETAIESARELLREINTASKDLRATIREYRGLADEARHAVAGDVQKMVLVEVENQLATLSVVIGKQMELSVARVMTEFDKLGSLLTDGPQGSLEDMILQSRGRKQPPV